MAWQQQQQIFDAMIGWAAGRGEGPAGEGLTAAPNSEAHCYLSSGSYWANLSPRSHLSPLPHLLEPPVASKPGSPVRAYLWPALPLLSRVTQERAWSVRSDSLPAEASC